MPDHGPTAGPYIVIRESDSPFICGFLSLCLLDLCRKHSAVTIRPTVVLYPRVHLKYAFSYRVPLHRVTELLGEGGESVRAIIMG